MMHSNARIASTANMTNKQPSANAVYFYLGRLNLNHYPQTPAR